MAAADPKSANQTELLLAEPEVKRFGQSLERSLREVMRRLAADEPGNPRAAQTARLIPLLAKTMLTRSGAVFVSGLEMKENQPNVEGGLLLEAGDDAKAIAAALAEVLTSPDMQAEDVSLGKTTFRRFAAQKGGLGELTVGAAGNYLIVGIGKGSVEGMVERLTAKKVSAWLVDMQKRHTLERRASLSMINLKSLLDAFLPLAGREGAGIGESLGLRQLGLMESSTGLDKEGMVSRTFLQIEGEPQGLLTLLDGEGITPSKVAFVPRDSIVASAFSLNLQQAYHVAAKVIADTIRGGRENVNSFAQEFEDRFGMRLEHDLLASLGDVWTLSLSPADGWLGIVATAELRDRDKLVEVLDRVKGSLADVPHRNQPRIETSKFGNYDLQTLIIRDVPVRLTWCITESRVIVGVQPQAVKSFMDVKASEAGLFSEPALASAWQGEGKPIAISYQDSAKVFEQTYGILTLLAPMLAEGMGDRSRFGGPTPLPQPPLFDVTSLPSSRSIHRHLRPSISVTRRTQGGIETEVRQTFPTPNIGASAPVAVALLLPAVQAARTAARRTQSQNNLRQIMLALHNHHDTYRRFPPQSSTDKDGKPLLSWRVMILPFMDQQALFKEFHHDEPWDSEHNKALIAKMPAVYGSPVSAAAPGKTVYLGVSGEKGTFPASKKPSLGPGSGLGLAEFTDGTSNTISVVEAGDESAVIWTKPDDFDPNEKEPLKGLLGLYPGGLNVAICDGSVKFVSQSIDPKLLMFLFQRNDGNAVPLR